MVQGQAPMMGLAGDRPGLVVVAPGRRRGGFPGPVLVVVRVPPQHHLQAAAAVAQQRDLAEVDRVGTAAWRMGRRRPARRPGLCPPGGLVLRGGRRVVAGGQADGRVGERRGWVRVRRRRGLFLLVGTGVRLLAGQVMKVALVFWPRCRRCSRGLVDAVVAALACREVLLPPAADFRPGQDVHQAGVEVRRGCPAPPAHARTRWAPASP